MLLWCALLITASMVASGICSSTGISDAVQSVIGLSALVSIRHLLILSLLYSYIVLYFLYC